MEWTIAAVRLLKGLEGKGLRAKDLYSRIRIESLACEVRGRRAMLELLRGWSKVHFAEGSAEDGHATYLALESSSLG
jgi:hypothetical protein